ncbi:MAG TPA: hypothetical protein VK054_12790, partial [Beutenbergiaceae bacterium]|nr:hypothetical protein [Beutenbergiaceae bacterium]
MHAQTLPPTPGATNPRSRADRHTHRWIQVYAALTSGHQISVIDVPHKKADFEWMKPYVREHGWGCDSLEQTL